MRPGMNTYMQLVPVCHITHTHTNKIKCVCTYSQQLHVKATLQWYMLCNDKISTVGSWATTRFHTLVDKTSKEVLSVESRAVPLQVIKLSLAVNYRLSCSPWDCFNRGVIVLANSPLSFGQEIVLIQLCATGASSPTELTASRHSQCPVWECACVRCEERRGRCEGRRGRCTKCETGEYKNCDHYSMITTQVLNNYANCAYIVWRKK